MREKSSANFVLEIEVGKDTVYLRKNIIRVEIDGNSIWEYDEEQISKDDFIARLQRDKELLRLEQTQTNTTLLELMEVVLIGGM